MFGRNCLLISCLLIVVISETVFGLNCTRCEAEDSAVDDCDQSSKKTVACADSAVGCMVAFYNRGTDVKPSYEIKKKCLLKDVEGKNNTCYVAVMELQDGRQVNGTFCVCDSDQCNLGSAGEIQRRLDTGEVTTTNGSPTTGRPIGNAPGRSPTLSWGCYVILGGLLGLTGVVRLPLFDH